MKKFRLLLSATLIVAAIGGAYAATFRNSCEYHQQYRIQSGSYVPAGQYGYDYMCWGTVGICTYYQPYYNGSYVPCRTGYYWPI